MTTRIVLVDDHEVMREGLRLLLEKEPDFQVVGEASDGREAMEIVREVEPDVVVMDVGMPELNGVEAAGQITKQVPHCKIVALSMHSDKRFVLAMFQAGATGYLPKKSAGTDLIQAIKAVAKGETYLCPSIAGAVMGDLLATGASGGPSDRSILTNREREILQLLAEGRSAKKIGSTLHISLSTVMTHRRQLMQKLGLHTVAELTKYAIRSGLTGLED